MAIELQPRGPAGADGFSVFVDTRSPNSNEGRDGEGWINAETGALLRKVAGAWRGAGNIRGPRGKDGDAGVSGRTILFGSEVPPSTLGRIGDTYIQETATGPVIYSPRGSTGWPVGKPLVAVIFGSVPPTALIGNDGQAYIDTVNHVAYGAKATGAWPVGVSFRGALPLLPLAAWATATDFVTGPPASFVSQGGSSYACLISHTSGTFATDLAAGKWRLVAQKGDTPDVFASFAILPISPVGLAVGDWWLNDGVPTRIMSL